jgi:hypothetical protein
MVTFIVSYIWSFDNILYSQEVEFIVPNGASLRKEMKAKEEEMARLGYKLISKVVGE